MIYAGLIAVVIRTFLFQPFNIPSGSMENTLLVGDYLFVEKFAYGYSRYTFPVRRLAVRRHAMHGRFLDREPQRGDVVVFKFPQDNSTDFIKRLIGLPGDRIQMSNDVLYLNGKPVPRERVARLCRDDLDGEDRPLCRNIARPCRAAKAISSSTAIPTARWTIPRSIVVPAGHYFMMGDNRDNSDDSRDGSGLCPGRESGRQGGVPLLLHRRQRACLGSLEMALRRSAIRASSRRSTDLGRARTEARSSLFTIRSFSSAR